MRRYRITGAVLCTIGGAICWNDYIVAAWILFALAILLIGGFEILMELGQLIISLLG